MVVVLPAPFGPSRPKHSPRSTSRSSPSTAITDPYRLTTPTQLRATWDEDTASIVAVVHSPFCVVAHRRNRTSRRAARPAGAARSRRRRPHLHRQRSARGARPHHSHQAALVAMQDEFAGTSRGAALINRVKDDPALRRCEVRVMAERRAEPRRRQARQPRRRPRRSPRTSRSRRSTAGHAARAAGPDQGRRRGLGRRQPGDAGRPVDGRRAGRVADRAQAQSARARDLGRRQDRREVRRRRSPGRRSRCRRACRPATAPASTGASRRKARASTRSPRNTRKDKA